ncbi:sigma 54-interacting transcriptional regulator [Sorangium sp. So ce145]|uniref:sigma 54-interacting transcriptional regulator n=1 Tax=Sorangium sp. So ce145 TaxID=3133285 RepID=UPI003F601ADF
MRAADLDIRKLLDVDARGGVVRFAGERAVILDAGALGTLREELVRLAGYAGARAVLTRFGVEHGARMAEAMVSRLPWDSEAELHGAGALLHTLQGFIRLAPGDTTPLASRGATLLSSYEAEQHLLHLGRADEPVCWMLAGIASGYMTRATGEAVYVIEDRCIGRGDDVCHFQGRTRAAWGAALAEHLPFFRESALDPWLGQPTQPAPPRRVTGRALGAKASALPFAAPRGEPPTPLVAESPAMRRALDRARRVAPVDSTILLTGESGAGKERVARLIHGASARAAGPFVAVNCAAITETLLESELFGHARGSFTGATHDRAGLFEAARGGTLLLDEVGEAPPGVQAKLLRALQERQVRRVGENTSRPVDARILAATNRDLAADAAAGRFRRDLYYRLRVIEIRLPPLRERREDVLPLARALLGAAARRLDRPVARFTPEAEGALERHGWPGNVRELENAVEHAVALARGGSADLEDLPDDVRGAAPTGGEAGEAPAAWTLEGVERRAILAALERHGGNQARAAAELGIGASTLYRKLRRYARGAG